jgi:hypothetical protein
MLYEVCCLSNNKPFSCQNEAFRLDVSQFVESKCSARICITLNVTALLPP